MTKYERIRSLCKQQGVTISQMERDLHFSRGSISKIDTHKPSIDRVAKISLYLGVSPMALMIDEESNIDDYNNAKAYLDAINDLPPVTVERSVSEVSAGTGRLNESYELDETIRATDEEYSKVRVCGDSMYPSLHDGDIVRVHHTTDDISPRDFAVVKINGDEAVIKHIEIKKDGLLIRSENEVYEDVFYSMQDCLTLPVTIIGKAVAIIERKL